MRDLNRPGVTFEPLESRRLLAVVAELGAMPEGPQMELGDRAVFAAGGELWVSWDDGTTGPLAAFDGEALVPLGGRAFWIEAADDGAGAAGAAARLFVTNGTGRGTGLVARVPGEALDRLVEYRGRLWWVALRAAGTARPYHELWVTDGTARGTFAAIAGPDTAFAAAMSRIVVLRSVTVAADEESIGVLGNGADGLGSDAYGRPTNPTFVTLTTTGTDAGTTVAEGPGPWIAQTRVEGDRVLVRVDQPGWANDWLIATNGAEQGTAVEHVVPELYGGATFDDDGRYYAWAIAAEREYGRGRNLLRTDGTARGTEVLAWAPYEASSNPILPFAPGVGGPGGAVVTLGSNTGNPIRHNDRVNHPAPIRLDLASGQARRIGAGTPLDHTVSLVRLGDEVWAATNDARLYRINPATGEAAEVDVGRPVLLVGAAIRGRLALLLGDGEAVGGRRWALYEPEVTPPLGSLAGRAFHDTNRNGVADEGEPPLTGWRVWLDLDGDDTKGTGEPTARTDAAGRYAFADWPAGSYEVRLTPATASFDFSTPPVARVDVNAFSGGSADFGGTDPAATGQVRARAFEDADFDGVWSEGERPLTGRMIYADLDGDGRKGRREPGARTDPDGTASFAVPAGRWTVRQVAVVRPGELTTPAPEVLVTGLADDAGPPLAFGSSPDAPPPALAGRFFADYDGDRVFDDADATPEAMFANSLPIDPALGDGSRWGVALVPAAGGAAAAGPRAAWVDNTTGLYRLEGVPPGGYELQLLAYGDGGEPLILARRPVTVGPGVGVDGDFTTADLPANGVLIADVSGGGHIDEVTLSRRDFAAESWRPVQVWQQWPPRDRFSIVVEGYPAGWYRLEIGRADGTADVREFGVNGLSETYVTL